MAKGLGVLAAQLVSARAIGGMASCWGWVKALAFGLLFGLAWMTSAYGTPGERFHIKEDNTGIHEGPSATASVVRHLNKGDRVIEFRRQGSWVKVSQLGAVGKDGWVEISRLAPEPRNSGPEQVVGVIAMPLNSAPGQVVGVTAMPPNSVPGQVVRVIETPPKITPDKIRPGEAVTPDTIRPGRCPAFNAATIDSCFRRFSSSRSSGYSSGTASPQCGDIPRDPSTYLAVNVLQIDYDLEQFYNAFSVSVGSGRAILSGAGSRKCGISKRVNRSQAHRCRIEILRSGPWRRFCS